MGYEAVALCRPDKRRRRSSGVEHSLGKGGAGCSIHPGGTISSQYYGGFGLSPVATPELSIGPRNIKIAATAGRCASFRVLSPVSTYKVVENVPGIVDGLRAINNIVRATIQFRSGRKNCAPFGLSIQGLTAGRAATHRTDCQRQKGREHERSDQGLLAAPLNKLSPGKRLPVGPWDRI